MIARLRYLGFGATALLPLVYTGAAHGQTVTMKTDNIGKKKAHAVESDSTPGVIATVLSATNTDEVLEEAEEFGPDEHELASLRAQEEAEVKTLQFLLASDDKLADLAARNTQLEAQIKLLDLRIAGLQNSNAEYIRTIKGLQNKLKKLEAST